MKHLRKKLKRNITFLRKKSKKFLNDRSDSDAAMWLTDNFHIIEKNYAAAVKASKSVEFSSRSSSITEDCTALCKDGILPDDEKITTFLLKKNTATSELRSLSFFIFYSLIEFIAKNIDSCPEKAINGIKSVIRMRDTDFGMILYEVSETEKILCQDPTGVYRNMDEGTKEQYREAVCRTAKKTNKSEAAVAVEALEKAKDSGKHIGFFLNLNRKKTSVGVFLILFEAILPLAVSIILSVFTKTWYLVFLIYLPMWESLKFITSTISSYLQKSEPLPKMEFPNGIPKEEKTVIAVSAMLPSSGKAREIIPHLKDLCLSNCGENTCICVLADLKPASTPTAPADKTDIKAMKRVIASLNQEYQGRFLLAIRPRVFSETENEYTGFERKRGAITSLIKFINGGGNDFLTLLGDEKKLLGAKHIMALDSDTEMPIGSLISLVETAAHPLNAPVISFSEQRITSGYGIISPRVETSIESAGKTLFSSVMAGSGGIPAYSGASGEKYQDFFSESIFSGKGLINAEAFGKLLTDRFPSQKILSHDILEGMILRTAFCGETALTDSFPSNENSYFKRLHRWIRGDIQNIPLIFKKRRSVPSGTLPKIGKWWLIDNIRRALTPVFAVLSLFLALFMKPEAAAAAGVTALASEIMPDLFSAVITIIRGGISMLSRLYFSSAAPYAMTCLLRAASKAIMLVRSAVCSLDGIIRALFRMAITKKHLLEWTTAADSEGEKSEFTLAKKSLSSVATGIILIIFGRDILRLSGIILLLDLPFAILSAKPRRKEKQTLTEKEKTTVISYCASMWKFYESLCTKEDNFLIPDNMQEAPVYSVARRTSPTNIGLMLCAFLAARDFNFISTAEMKTMIDNSIDSIEKLEKYKGNLYNWYSSKTLETLSPRFVSCVDSGNFLCCLVALKEGLKEYKSECPELEKTIERLEQIISATDLGFMFDKRRNLFHIGYDCESNEFTPSYFDLLMSEARMTSYYAAASGAVPVKHWQTLGRTLSKSGRYTGPVSWSGTMFEYFMPAIFLPSIRGSLGSEALRFCIHCQKKRVKNMNIPYGISESGFFAFDRELNYQYKAHGVSALSLRTSPDDKAVISPYSTFLTLPIDPHGGTENLKRLEKLGMYGKFGFYEAADFTADNSSAKGFSFVRSYMAHHVGMSFSASANAVFGNIMQKRFMSDDRMAGGRSLLYEKIPSDAKVYKNIERRDAPKRPERMPKIKAEHSRISLFSPNSQILTNGEWTVCGADNGMNHSFYRNSTVFKKHYSPIDYPDGIFAAIKKQDGGVLPFTFAPRFGEEQNFSAFFSENSIQYKNSGSEFSCTQTITLHPKYPAELINFSVHNRTKSEKEITLMIYAEPALTGTNENISHPAFSNMFIDCKKDNNEKLVYFTRNQRSKGSGLYIVCGFLSKADFDCCFDREAVLSRNTGIFGLFNNDFDSESESVDKCIALQLKLHIPPKSTVNETIVLCGSDNFEEAVNHLAQIRKSGVPSIAKQNYSPFEADGIGGIYAKKITDRLFFSADKPTEIKAALRKNTLSRGDLWSLGISGDFPIILVKIGKDEETYMNAFIKMHAKLKLMGIITELVLLSDTAQDYVDFMQNAVRKLSSPDSLNSRGGIFTLHTSSIKKEMFMLLLASSIAVYPEKASDNKAEDLKLSPVLPSDKIANTGNMFIENGYFINQPSYLPWSHIICNKNFGTLISDSSLGYTWCMNSRENKLTNWKNDTRSESDGEKLILTTENGRFDIIKGSSAFFSFGKGQYSSEADSLFFKTEITVDGENMCKIITVSIINQRTVSANFTLSYLVEPVLGDNSGNRKYIQYEKTDNGAFAYTPYNTTFGGFLFVSSDKKSDFSFSKASFLTNTDANGDTDCIIATRKIYLPSKSDITVRFYLSYAKNKTAAEKMLNIAPKKTNRNKIEIDTPDRELNDIFNNFLPNQIIGGRIHGRTGFYQCSGAYGFRDQLQDAMAVVLTHPEILKIQIFRCAAAQFTEGDVLHWFHEFIFGRKKILRGVRTQYSDDLLWLPLAVSEYCLKSGDTSILNVDIPFIDAPVLEKGEAERFGEYTFSDKKDTLLNHCLLAIRHASAFGSHSLPLIKGGDWNDSFNLVGAEGKGESVWLAMFLAYTAQKFAALCKTIGNEQLYSELRTLADNLYTATDNHAWDNDRYLRCFYDDGTPMGKSGNESCEIDLLPQSWSVISGMPNKERCLTAIETAYKKLVDAENGVIKLFSPPFTAESKLSGYVNMYPPGIRENGGQYSHGAVWLADAFFRANNPEKGYELINILNPAKKNPAVYKTEPYYLAGDVYSREKMEGRGGWSLYTGSAGWFYRTVYEQMLGIKETNGEIKIKPCLPKGFERSRVKIITENGTREFIL